MKKYLYSIAVAILALTACTKEYENTYIITPEELDGIATLDELNVILPEQTKTYLSGYNVLWQANDKITAWSSYADDAKTFTIYGETGNTTATFKTDPGKGVKFPLEGVTTFYAVYPSNNSKAITVRSSQTWKGYKDFYQNVNPMIGRSTDFNNIQFINPCSIIAINLIADKQQTARLNSIVLSSQSKILSGTAEVIDWNVEDLSKVELDWTSSSHSVTLMGGNQVISSETKSTYYIVVPAGEYSDLTVTVNYTSDKARNLSKTRQLSEMRELLAGHIFEYTAPITLETLDPKELEKYEIGDVYPKNSTDPVVGVVFDVAADGLSGKIIALNDCTAGGTSQNDGRYYTYAWTTFTDGYDVYTKYPALSQTNGATNMDKVKSVISSFPAFKACSDLTTGSLSWYLPAQNELNLMFANYGDYQDALVNNGGTGFTAPQYWSSNMVGSEYAVDVVYYKRTRPIGIAQFEFETLGTCAVRAIAKFESK